MAKCDTCGNDYDGAFTLTMNDQTFTFDSFECAIHRLAPSCEHCGCRIIGHGVQKGRMLYCCANCAHAEGVSGLEDRA